MIFPCRNALLTAPIGLSVNYPAEDMKSEPKELAELMSDFDDRVVAFDPDAGFLLKLNGAWMPLAHKVCLKNLPERQV